MLNVVRKREGTILSGGINKYLIFFVCFMATLVIVEIRGGGVLYMFLG